MLVYTAITNGKDTLNDAPRVDGVRYVAYTDALVRDSWVWEHRQAPSIFTDPRRNAKMPKILSHTCTDGDEYSLWLDGSIKLNVSAIDLADRYLKDADIALMKHPERDCAYDEANVCVERRLDDEQTILEQMARYEWRGYPKRQGLHCGGIILRRHTPKIVEFNNFWWAEICRGSVRDQLSLDYSLWKTGVVPATLELGEEVTIGQHLINA